MSDEEFYSEESYEFEFEEDDDEAEDENIAVNEDNDENDRASEDEGIERRYYSAKAMKFDDTDMAIKSLQSLIDSYQDQVDDSEITDWIFKSYKQLMKISFHNSKLEDSIQYLTKILELLPKVNKNYGEESLSRIISNYSVSNDQKFIDKLYDTVLTFLNTSTLTKGSNYDRLWIKISLYKLTSHLDDGDYASCPKLIESINAKVESVPPQVKKSYSLDLIALEIQYYSEVSEAEDNGSKYPSNLPILKQLYRKSLEITTTVTHPKILGRIREFGGKIHFYRGNFEKARLEFYESFNNYDEAGSSLKKRVLKYLILCSLLTENQFNPFESQETSTYSSLPEYSNLLQLIKAYDGLNIRSFVNVVEKIRQENDPMTKDAIFNYSIDQILHNLKVKSILKLLKAYRSIKFESIIKNFHLSQSQLEGIFMQLTVAGKMGNIKLDFVNQVILSEASEDEYSQDIFPCNLSTRDIFTNMKIADNLLIEDSNENDYGDGMEIDRVIHEDPEEDDSANSARESRVQGFFSSDMRGRNSGFSLRVPENNERTSRISSTSVQKTSALCKLLFVTEVPSKDVDWYRIIDLWYNNLLSCIPKPAKDQLSQKDQIVIKQRNENVINNARRDTQEYGQNGPDINNVPNGASAEENTSLDDNENELELQIHKVDLLENWTKRLGDYFDGVLKIT